MFALPRIILNNADSLTDISLKLVFLLLNNVANAKEFIWKVIYLKWTPPQKNGFTPMIVWEFQLGLRYVGRKMNVGVRFLSIV